MSRRNKKKRRFFGSLVKLILLALIIFGCYRFYIVKSQVEEVKLWKPVVAEEASRYGLEEFDDVILAIILTETKGQHIDLMQSSESKYGEQNQITSSEESIKSGVKHLAEVLTQSQNEGTDIWTGVQAYNFGSNYIPYVRDNGGRHNVKIAERYSREVLAPLLGNNSNKRYRYLTLRALKYNKGHLYIDGGNFFYADIVKWNMSVLDVMSKIPWFS
ncbi:hypothetical protein CBF31_03035 [Vagococcus fessus]|uniref:CwlT-like lysozyme domain-containing protein n=1 Tax=Vagococcus fessus TaxID=120370 RepID=A0A430ACQ9_9ENTE|nr:hypothetical protein CBF31_03035 [Vagococcus fessus]